MPGCGILPINPRQDARSAQNRSRRAYTLIELVISALLASLLLMGMQSAVFIASKAVPKASPPSCRAAQYSALDRIALDVSYAEELLAPTSTAIELLVADHDDDGDADVIRYSWDGVTGSPFQRTFNSADPETLVADIRALTFTLQTEIVNGEPVYEEGNETLLAIYAPAAGNTNYSIDEATWAAQYIPVTLAAGVADYRTTRVRLDLATHGSKTGVTAVELRGMRAQSPTSRVFARSLVTEASLKDSSEWTSIPLASDRRLEPQDQIGLVIRPTTAPPSCKITYKASGAPATAGAWFTSANSGGSWTSTSGAALCYEVWGVCRTVDYPDQSTRATVLRVSITAGANAPIELSLPLTSRPIVAP